VDGQSAIAGLTGLDDVSTASTPTLVWRTVEAAERVCAAVLLILFLPALALLAGLIYALSRRPPLVAHQRVGQSGKPIWVLKLRTMWESGACGPCTSGLVEQLRPESACPPGPKEQLDPRVTSRVAAFCRKFSIDELPQLWHVACGDMALMGPRPLTSMELQLHYGASAVELLAVKPGLTGLWQTTGRSRLSYPQRRRLDLFLVRNWSASLYLRILFRTIPAVLTGRDAW
jgi:lipopolysaccharide/colanic/teichoic acid biosynthesis glycosyltransferase